MSAVLHWRCDVCRSEAEVVEEVPRGLMVFFHPKLPSGWAHKAEGAQKGLDLCSQSCVVAYTQSVLAREQRKLADNPGGTA